MNTAAPDGTSSECGGVGPHDVEGSVESQEVVSTDGGSAQTMTNNRRATLKWKAGGVLVVVFAIAAIGIIIVVSSVSPSSSEVMSQHNSAGTGNSSSALVSNSTADYHDFLDDLAGNSDDFAGTSLDDFPATNQSLIQMILQDEMRLNRTNKSLIQRPDMRSRSRSRKAGGGGGSSQFNTCPTCRIPWPLPPTTTLPPPTPRPRNSCCDGIAWHIATHGAVSGLSPCHDDCTPEWCPTCPTPPDSAGGTASLSPDMWGISSATTVNVDYDGIIMYPFLHTIRAEYDTKCDDDLTLDPIHLIHECPQARCYPENGEAVGDWGACHLQRCDRAGPGELCEGDGECGTDQSLDNCGGMWDMYRKRSGEAGCELRPIPPYLCPARSAWRNFRNCAHAGLHIGEFCEGDGERGTDKWLNNCGGYDFYRQWGPCVGTDLETAGFHHLFPWDFFEEPDQIRARLAVRYYP